MWHAPQGIHAFLRAYYHMKSADWKQNQPPPLAARTAARVGEAAALLRDGSRQGHGGDRRGRDAVGGARSPRTSGCPTPSCASTASEYGRTGFQGGLKGYRVGSSGRFTAELQLFAGRTIDVPSMFIGGKSDWGVYQNPGALERHAEDRVHEDARRRTWSTAPATGCSRSSRRRSASCSSTS